MSTSPWSSTCDKDSDSHKAVAELYKAGFEDLGQALRAITITAAGVLQTDRAGVWLFSSETTAVYCIHEHVHKRHDSDYTSNYNQRDLLHFSPDEPYMVKLHEGPVVAFESTDTKHASPTFRSYLQKLGPKSLLDVPLRVDGEVVGMLCLECTAGRSWRNEELDWAIRLGDIATLAIEADRHRRATLLGDRFRTLVEQTPDSVVLSDKNGHIEYLNLSARRLFGLARDEPIQGERLSEFMAPENSAYALRSARVHAHDYGSWTGELSLFSRTGHNFDAHITMTSYRGRSGAVEYMSYTIRNVSSRVALERRLEDTQAQYDAVIAQTSDAMFQVDVETGRLHRANNAFCNLLGYSPDEVESMTIFDLVEDTVESIQKNINASLEQGSLFMSQRQYQHRDGYWVDVEVAAAAVIHEGRPTLNVRARDITALLQRQRDVERLAYYDPVTGLANSNLLRERGETLLAESLEDDVTPVCYIITQIGSWQRLVDTLGYQAAESLLKQVAERLGWLIGDREILIARLLTGAEFGLLFKTTAQDAPALAAEISDAFTAPVTIEDQPVHLTMRSGMANFPRHAGNFKELTMRAGIALRRAHLKNKNYCVYEPAQSGRLHDERLLEEDLRQAIGTEQIQFHYQPIITPAGQVTGMETLVRWHHPQEGWLPPSHFIPLAEDNGLIVDLDFSIIAGTIQTASQWLHKRPDIVVGFNCSALTLANPDLTVFLRQTLEKNQLPPSQVCIEVTETALMHDRQTATVALEQISALGVKIALDDFGTGYSSLAYIKHLPVDILKIDGIFVRDIGTDVRDERAIETIISLGHSLGMQVVAEGVETLCQSKWLVARGVDWLQGFYFGKPQSLAELQKNEHTIRPPQGGTPTPAGH